MNISDTAKAKIIKGIELRPKKIDPYIDNAITGVKLGGCGIYRKNNIIIQNDIKRKILSFILFFIKTP